MWTSSTFTMGRDKAHTHTPAGTAPVNHLGAITSDRWTTTSFPIGPTLSSGCMQNPCQIPAVMKRIVSIGGHDICEFHQSAL
jgi:hypothetical protein